MDNEPPPYPLDPDIRLQRDTHYESVHSLRRMLPPPPIGTPEAWLMRDEVALGSVAALVPASPPEARLAANHVAAMDHASDCMHRAGLYDDTDPKLAGRLRAQSASMGREARGYYNTLLRMQATRQKREANSVTCESAAMTEHCVLGLMQDALARAPPGPPQTDARVAAEAASAAAGTAAAARAAGVGSTTGGKSAAADAAPAAPKQFLDYKDWPEEVKRKDRLRSAVDRYAIVHTMRAQLIRKLRRLPDNCDFEPPEPEVLEALINGDSLNLRWCDEYVPWAPPAEE
jgi:hypothetical protein